jgi:multicomponent Na+:H+ antiporter subunit F
MDMYVFWIMLAFLVSYLIRLIRGPSIWDRFLSLSIISTKILLIILLFASYEGISYLLDLAIVYGLLGFISTVFIALFLLARMKRGKKT